MADDARLDKNDVSAAPSPAYSAAVGPESGEGGAGEGEESRSPLPACLRSPPSLPPSLPAAGVVAPLRAAKTRAIAPSMGSSASMLGGEEGRRSLEDKSPVDEGMGGRERLPSGTRCVDFKGCKTCRLLCCMEARSHHQQWRLHATPCHGGSRGAGGGGRSSVSTVRIFLPSPTLLPSYHRPIPPSHHHRRLCFLPAAAAPERQRPAVTRSPPPPHCCRCCWGEREGMPRKKGWLQWSHCPAGRRVLV